MQRKGMLRPVGAAAWLARGRALELTDADGAMHAYRRAVAGCPDVPDAYTNLGRLHHERGELADAESCYRLALCGDPTSALFWFNLGVVLDDVRRESEAIEAYERALAIDATLADAHHNVARLYETIGRRTGDDLLVMRAIRHLGRSYVARRRSSTIFK